MTGGVSSLDQARAALASGGWSDARAAFERAVQDEPSPEALFGLAVASWWLGETEGALAGWERAYTASVAAGDLPQAVFSAVYLCLGYEMTLGNEALATGWVDRADELVTAAGLTPFVGWVLLCRAHLANDHGDPAAAEGWAREAVERARGEGDVDLELCATGELGTSLVESGRFDEGLRVLGSAMARALAGEATDPDAVVLIGCRIVTSCSRAFDPKGALRWVRAADGFNERFGSVHLFTTCRAHYGAILLTTGAWDEAERELLAALEIGRRAEPELHAEATATLAELRLAQGRIDEAARLLRGLESHGIATLAIAGLHLARGDAAAAAALLERRLRSIPEERLETASLTELLVEADIARGALPEATDRAAGLLERGIRVGCDPIVARASQLVGRVRIASHDPAGAREHLERALAIFDERGLAFAGARTRLLLARTSHDRDAAVAEARAALHAFETIGAARDADEAAAFIRSLGARVPRGGPSTDGLLTRREREVVLLLAEGLGNKDIAERLFITRKTVEHHVGSVLAKLGLRSRAEVAAYAARHLAEDHAQS